MANGNSFAGGLMIGCGILIALVFGTCSAIFVSEVFREFQSGHTDTGLVEMGLLFAVLPLLFGLFLVFMGVKLVRNNRDR